MEETIVLPSDHFRKRVKAQYRDVRLAIIREVLQNSADAGATRVDFTLIDGSWSASDDGCGMDLPGFRKFFLTLGGTKKRTHSIGGFGAAKEVLSFAWPTWYAKGQSFRVDGKGASAPISKEAEYAGVAKGFALGASDPEMFPRYDMVSAVKSVVHRSSLPLDVYVNGELVPVIKPDMTLHKRFKWGDLMLVNGSHGWMGSGCVYIRHGGLHSSEKYIGGPNTFVLELNTNMDADKVFTESRDALKYELNAELDKATAELREKAHRKPNPVLLLYNGANRPRDTNVNDDGEGGGDIRIHSDTKTRDEQWPEIDFPFAIYSDNGPRKMLKRYTPMIRVVERALRLAAKTFGTTMPVPGLLILSKENDTLGIHKGDGRYARGIMFSLDAINKGPVALVAYVTHEFTHDERSWHDEGFAVHMSGLIATSGMSYINLMLSVAEAYKEFGIAF